VVMDNPNKAKVLLLTNKFPYGIVETFIEAELEAIPDGINLTILPTQIRSLHGTKRRIPDNIGVDVLLEGNPKFIYPLKALQMVFSKAYWDEIGFRKRKGIFKLSDYYTMAGYFGRAKEIADTIEKKYKKELQERRVVLYSYWFATAAYAEMILNRKYGVRCVTRAHRTDVYEKHCFYEVMPGQLLALEGLTKVFVCSKDGMRYLQDKFPAHRDKIDCSYLGTKNYGFRPGDNRSEEFVIASCSRLVPVKRVHLLAKALATITDKKIHWVHIGDGEEHDNIESIVKLFPKNIRVSFAGNIPHDAVMEYYRDHEINAFVNVSESEGLPVSIMEVISFGIPVIATDVGGTGEVVNNEMGYLLPNDFSAENLVEEINELIAMEPSQYIQLRNRIRKFWEDNFSAERNYTKYYKEITDGQR
jgi:colanic acid/amylovoran biosynthesis glycosyltransferase